MKQVESVSLFIVVEQCNVGDENGGVYSNTNKASHERMKQFNKLLCVSFVIRFVSIEMKHKSKSRIKHILAYLIK